MNETLQEREMIIYYEMMAHPALFTHHHAKTVAIIHDENSGILQEVLKHKTVVEAWQIAKQKSSAIPLDARAKHFFGDATDWIQQAKPNSIDVLIIDHPVLEHADLYFNLLHPEGILVQQSVSSFQLQELKALQQQLLKTGFADVQMLNFAFTSELRSAIMGIKKGAFKRIREKDIFNKSFVTRYYNFDIHKASLAMPEFMRKEFAHE